MTMSRREFARSAAAAAMGFAATQQLLAKTAERAKTAGTAKRTEIGGIPFGVHTFSFHQIREGGMPAVDEILAATQQLGLNSVELFAPQLAPFPLPEGLWKRWWAAAHPAEAASAPPSQPLSPEERAAQREKLRRWRTTASTAYFTAIRKKFDAAGIEIFALNYSFDETMNDAEVDAGFEQAKALGVQVITSASTISFAQKLVPFAERHRRIVAFHNTTSPDPDRVVAPAAYARLMAMSPRFRINLDTAHLSAAGYNPVRFLEEHHDHIVSLHIHDRKNNNGASVPNGEGDTPLKALLTLLQTKDMRIPSFYELEWIGSGDSVAEIQRDLHYLRTLVAA